MRNRIFILILLIIILVELSMFFSDDSRIENKNISNQTQTQIVPNTLSPQAIKAERIFWSKTINEIGGEKTYKEFKDKYKNENFGTQHLMAHVVGTFLYQKEGIKGQAICDSTFSFGCYHSFFSQALADKGPSIINDLDKACLDKFGTFGSGCQHGIGHGVMEYYGPKRLIEALISCKSTTANTPLSGCASGVFMEYNVPIIITDVDAVSTARPLDIKNPYMPCTSVPENFKEACYYSLSQWWNQTSFYMDKWGAQGLLCKNIPDSLYMDTCYLGIGNVVAPDSMYEPKKAVAMCKEMPDLQSIIFCQAGASWSFAANPQYEVLAKDMCEELDTSSKQECLLRSNLLNPAKQ